MTIDCFNINHFLNVYEEDGTLLQSIRSRHESRYYCDMLTEFKFDSNNNLVNLLYKNLIRYDSKKDFIKNIYIKVDHDVKPDVKVDVLGFKGLWVDSKGVKYCIDKFDKIHYIHDLIIYYE